jgi:hypothetical protein
MRSGVIGSVENVSALTVSSEGSNKSYFGSYLESNPQAGAFSGAVLACSEAQLARQPLPAVPQQALAPICGLCPTSLARKNCGQRDKMSRIAGTASLNILSSGKSAKFKCWTQAVQSSWFIK